MLLKSLQWSMWISTPSSETNYNVPQIGETKNTWDKLLVICCIGNYLGELNMP